MKKRTVFEGDVETCVEFRLEFHAGNDEWKFFDYVPHDCAAPLDFARKVAEQRPDLKLRLAKTVTMVQRSWEILG